VLKLPVQLFEAEDLAELRRRCHKSLPVVGGDISFSNNELRVLEQMLTEGEASPRARGAIMNSVLLRAVSLIVVAAPRIKTVSDAASLLAAALQVASIDPVLGNRCLSIIRLPPQAR